ncbi:hypothetical protein LWC34_10995 [Kibdelosporangium philippinense]|uniref:Uncharacterized protein n=1 Tax=Kibdelosporangium philippinense TaxID=211113 RepID=A0ABS8Z637_9PSEU|nr:hypothetical protein [Kibdelosporangium philippinense]MCE7003349.1 hypothetical protein [Kibdelosporangium philippinense]
MNDRDDEPFDWLPLRLDTGDGQAVNQRVKTWQDGWLPILSETFERDGVKHTISFFSAKVDGVTKVPYAQRR